MWVENYAISEIHFKIEIKRSSEINEELIISAFSNKKMKNFRSKYLTNCSNDPFNLEINHTNYMIVKGYEFNKKSSYEINIKFTNKKDNTPFIFKSVIAIVIIFFLLFLIVTLIIVINRK